MILLFIFILPHGCVQAFQDMNVMALSENSQKSITVVYF